MSKNAQAPSASKGNTLHPSQPILSAFRITILYVSVGSAWILLSDTVLLWFSSDEEWLAQSQSMKGIGYVFITGLILYGLITLYSRALVRTEIEKREAAELLASQSTFIRSVLDAMTGGVVSVDGDTNTVYLNPAARAILGHDHDFSNIESLLESCQLMREDQSSLCTLDDFPLTHALAGKALDDIELYMPGDTGREARWIRMSARPLKPGNAESPSAVAVITDMTRTHQQQIELIEGRRMLSTLLRNLPGMAHRFRNEPGIPMEFVSDGSFALTGYSPGEFTSGRVSFVDLIHPDDRAKITFGNQAFLNPDHTYHLTYRILTKSGETRWVTDIGRAVEFEAGKPLILEGFIMDVTDQRRSVARLEESEAYFRSLIENIQDVITLIRPDGTFAYVSPSMQRVAGYAPEELLDHPIDEYIHPDDYAHVTQVLGTAITQTGFTQRIAYRFRHHDGHYLYAEAEGKSIMDQDGQPVVVVNARDVTERMKANVQLTRLVTALEQTHEAIVVTDVDGTMEYVNPAFERITGYTREEALGHKTSLLRSGHHDLTFYQDMWSTIKQGNVWYGHMVNRRKNGETYEERATISPVFASDGSIVNFVAVKQDITLEVLMERRFREHQKLEAIGTLAGGIAHDFNNILSAVIGYTELAVSELPPESPVVADLREVLNAGDRARELVRQILTFSRQGGQEKQPLRLDVSVREALKMMRATLPSTIEVKEIIDPNCGNVMANPTQMHQVVMNLCTNAAHAMRDHGGVLTVSLSPAHITDDGEAAFNGLEPGPYAELCVRDTGHGIDPDVLPRIFEPFFSTKRQEGTGLGLSTVHGIVRNHGGEITVESEPGHGAAFRILLPSVRAGSLEDAVDEDAPEPGDGQHVLLVDDEETLSRLGGQLVERLGYKATTRTSSVEALEAFRAQPEKFDLIITDQTMPHMTGIELAAHIRKIRGDIPIIVTTGFSDQLTPSRVTALGISAVVLKPILARDLAAAMHNALANPAAHRSV